MFSDALNRATHLVQMLTLHNYSSPCEAFARRVRPGSGHTLKGLQYQ